MKMLNELLDGAEEEVRERVARMSPEQLSSWSASDHELDETELDELREQLYDIELYNRQKFLSDRIEETEEEKYGIR